MNAVPQRVRIVEVGPRDGLQNEAETLSIEQKLAFIGDLIAAGLPAVEIGAFVRSDRVPQMADSDEVVRRAIAGLADEGGNRPVQLWALVPNLRGLERARSCGLRHVAVFTATSDAFSRANVGLDAGASLARVVAVMREARAEGLALRAYVSTAFLCPFEGRIAAESVKLIVERLVGEGCEEVVLADTIGAATPGDVTRLLELLLEALPPEVLGVHFHDTRGGALANVLTALRLGVSSIDAAAGGLGGCPFAPGAQGNLATEDLLFALHGMGIETGVDLEAVRRASLALQQLLSRSLPSRYLRAGPPPRG